MSKKVVILGAGPAGLALAMKLLRRRDIDVEVIVVEKESHVGGLTGSFECEGLIFDYGSHRLHPATSPDILDDIRDLLGPDLLDRPRNGRIRVLGRFIRFPLNALDLTARLPLSFLSRIVRDKMVKPFGQKSNARGSFADVLLDNLGPAVCDVFYFPYARKMWGLDPGEIDGEQARRRVSAKKIHIILGKALWALPGFKRRGSGRFYYPRKGFGQISLAFAQEIKRLGGHLHLSTAIREVCVEKGRMKGIVTKNGEVLADFVFSTIPIAVLAGALSPRPPSEVGYACRNLKYRGMVLHYMVLETERFTPFDAHYFPEQDVVFSRLSEPKNYIGSSEPSGLTGLCAEIPCDVGDEMWKAPEQEVSDRVVEDLRSVGLPVRSPVRESFVRRIPYAYPVYHLGFEKEFQIVDGYLEGIPGLVSLGRQGLFVHDNTHHAIEMAYRASECLEPDLNWNSGMWRLCRERFSQHVVED